MKFHEQPKRSIVKSITFRIVVLISDTIIIYLLTHKIEATIGLVILTNISSTTLYFLHERFWNHIHWGRSLRR